jgi:hypothetical protein
LKVGICIKTLDGREIETGNVSQREKSYAVTCPW